MADNNNSEGKRGAGKPFSPGVSGNPGGRPRVFREYQTWLHENAFDKAKEALLKCLDDKDGKVRLAAVKEVADRLFGKAPQTVTDLEGNPISSTIGAEIIEILKRINGG